MIYGLIIGLLIGGTCGVIAGSIMSYIGLRTMYDNKKGKL